MLSAGIKELFMFYAIRIETKSKKNKQGAMDEST
jgi:hypothetical protein